MSRFRYWRDGLCLVACALYAFNRWGLRPHVHSAFLRGQFNDLLLIPAALPLVLGIQRFTGLRSHDQPPTAREIGGHLVVWSVLFEVIGPHLVRRATGDPLDVLAYAAGAALAWWWWHRDRLRSPRMT